MDAVVLRHLKDGDAVGLLESLEMEPLRLVVKDQWYCYVGGAYDERE